MSVVPIPRNPLVDPDQAATTLAASAALMRLLSEIDQKTLSPQAYAALGILSVLIADALDYERLRVDRAVSGGPSG